MPGIYEQEVLNLSYSKTTRILGFNDEFKFLSNFYPSPFIYAGFTWPHVEAAYQAHKTENKDDWREFLFLSGAQAKKKGGDVLLRKDWNDIKLQLMYELVYAKFASNPILEEMLLVTGDVYLEETNWWHDRYWGVSYGKGENHLGKILMIVRDKLRSKK